MIPASVMIALKYFAGVTSNPGLNASTPSGAIGTPRNSVISFDERSSISIWSPLLKLMSTVLMGAAT